MYDYFEKLFILFDHVLFVRHWRTRGPSVETGRGIYPL